MQITYQKRDGTIFQRLRETYLPHKVGETTSMGWKVLAIKYQDKDKFYTEYEYSKLIYIRKKRNMKKKHIKKVCLNELKTLLYYIIGLLIITLFNII